jgi:L-alanine-DL-glutamate epimerase-like enolase superfamily enzyme
MNLEMSIERWPLAVPFRITGRVFEHVDVLIASVQDGEWVGRGEAAGVYYRDESPASMQAQIEAVREPIEQMKSPETLLELLPPGGARNAVDCAWWDLEAKRTRCPAWQRANVRSPKPLLTTWTLGAEDPQTMARNAARCVGARALKLKLTGEALDADRVRAVREERPDVWLGVDANQGFTRQGLEQLLPVLMEARVELIEQPFAAGKEQALDGIDCPIPIAADESVQDRADLRGVVGRFQVINIKLDKCGGLTEALALAREARDQGLRLMVGNMVGTSLAMAPAFIVGQLCDIVDLDGPLLLARDRVPSAQYDNGHIWCGPEIWGAS